MKKHKKSLLLVALLLLVAIATTFVGGTYAKYSGEISGSGTATVAKWAFTTDNSISTINVNLAQTYDASTLVANRIAPGTNGSFAIALNNATSETGVDFTVTLGTITNAPTNLKFYKDGSFTTEIAQGGTLTGQLAAGDSTGLNITIYWKWAYETGTVTDGVATGDTDDTTAGTAGSALTIPVTVRGVQTTPSTTAITSHVN